MDFSINMNQGIGEMSFDPENTIMVNIWLSLNVRQGSFFYDPAFGSRLHLLKKNTARNVNLAIAYAKEALQWIIDCGKATDINVAAWRDEKNLNRLNLYVEAMAADGNTVTYTQWIEVV